MTARRVAVAALLLLIACKGLVDFRANYNPMKYRITIVARAQGATQSGTVDIRDLVIGDNGCAEINNPQCGKIRICGFRNGEAPTNLKLVCNDPAVFELPERWSVASASWTDKQGKTGAIQVAPFADFDAFGPAVAKPDPGQKVLVANADTDFVNGFDGSLAAEIDTAGEDASGYALKGFDVVLVRFFNASNQEVRKPQLVVPEGKPAIDFTAATPTFSTKVTTGQGATGTVQQPFCGGCATNRSTRGGALAAGLLLCLWYVARRRLTRR